MVMEVKSHYLLRMMNINILEEYIEKLFSFMRKGNYKEMKLINKRITYILFILVLMFSICSFESFATPSNVQTRTRDEIINYIKNNPTDIFKTADTYAEQPSVSVPYSAGRLSNSSLQNALNAVNQCRFIAGLESVTLDESYSDYAQKGSLLLRVKGELNHHHSKPADMSNELYNDAYTGTSSSNISYGYYNVADSVISGYMDDSDTSNIDRVGHRRWVLNPSMGKTGFGKVGIYSAMYAFDKSNSSPATIVSWPAQLQPTAYFDKSQAWSVSFGVSVNASTISVKLTRTGDNKVWNFSSNESDGSFYVNNSGYGQTGCVIFLPNKSDSKTNYADGERYLVEISNYDGAGSSYSYNVEFFNVPGLKTTEETPDDIIDDGDNQNDEDETIEEDENKENEDEDIIISVSNTKFKSIKSGKNYINLKWNKKSVSGYKIQYSTSSSFKKNKTKTKNISSSRIISTKIKGLKSNKKYYLRIRPYKVVDGVWYYSNWSSKKTIKTKRE